MMYDIEHSTSLLLEAMFCVLHRALLTFDTFDTLSNFKNTSKSFFEQRKKSCLKTSKIKNLLCVS